jgi:hypothetical protein
MLAGRNVRVFGPFRALTGLCGSAKADHDKLRKMGKAFCGRFLRFCARFGAFWWCPGGFWATFGHFLEYT